MNLRTRWRQRKLPAHRKTHKPLALTGGAARRAEEFVPYFYLQRASRPGWVHYCRDGIAHVTTHSWRLWFWSFRRARGQVDRTEETG